jgi:serine protease Do
VERDGEAMGYYDDFHDPPRRQPKRGGFWHGLIGAIIGGLLVLSFIPALIERGILHIPPTPSTEVPNEQGTPRENQESVGPKQTVNVDVSTAISQVVEDVEDAVVGVVNLQKAEDFWSRRSTVIQNGTGSGVIFNVRGNTVYIITNYHVIEDATQVEVVLANGERVEAQVKGEDPLTDLAVLAISKPDMEIPAISFGNSDNLKPGEPAIAIGNPLGLEYSRTVTVGVISSTDRSIPQDIDGDGSTDWEMDVLQTDAAINPGNSGGALINIAGQLIGINSAKISEVGIEGMGFAIPINEAKPIIDDLLRYGVVRRPYIGIGPKDLQEIDVYHWTKTLNLPENIHAGVVVIEVSPGSPADRGGLKELDVIVKLDDEEIRSSTELRQHLYKRKKIGENIKVTFYRDGELHEVTFPLAEFKNIP